jgi:polyphenol oxidase
MITLAALADDDATRHAFFTREGGVSDGIFASLNCGFGSGDDKDKVARNRDLAMARLGLAGDALVTCHQIHSATVVTVERGWAPGAAPKADGMVTNRPGIALGVLAADCAPILFADPEAGVVGAAHGGWRGTLSGVGEATVAAMVGLGARTDRIRAGIGPCIAQASYEVGAEFPERFAAEDASSRQFFAPGAKTGKFLFDLPGYIAHRLSRLGLAALGHTGGDTAAERERFFSYRRACLTGERDYGRGLAAIALNS